jgi:hypothetical protein
LKADEYENKYVTLSREGGDMRKEHGEGRVEVEELKRENWNMAKRMDENNRESEVMKRELEDEKRKNSDLETIVDETEKDYIRRRDVPMMSGGGGSSYRRGGRNDEQQARDLSSSSVGTPSLLQYAPTRVL